MPDIRGICFDLGSTLLQFDGQWNQQAIQQGVDRMVQYLSIRYTFNQQPFKSNFIHCLEKSRAEREIDYVERRTRDILRDVFLEQTGKTLTDDVLDDAMAALYAITQKLWGEMPGVLEMLDTLHRSGYKMAIISNAADAADVHRLIKQFNLQNYFKPVLISAEQGMRKPHQQMFESLLEAWGFKPEEIVMVGDTLNADIAGARQAGMHQIWLQRDLRPHEDPADETAIQPEQTAVSLHDIPALIENLRG